MRPGLDLVSTRDIEGIEIKIYGSYSRTTCEVDYDFYEVYADDAFLQSFTKQPQDQEIRKALRPHG